MSDLRSRCLTAMTEAMVDEAPALFDDYAAAGLDALLGVLEDPWEWCQSHFALMDGDECEAAPTLTRPLVIPCRSIDVLIVPVKGLKSTTEEAR